MEMETVTLTLTREQLNAIVLGLHELPGRMCIPMLNLINAQIEAQADAQSAQPKGAEE